MRYKLRVQVDPSWLPTDRLRLYKGTEGAANLASSTPSGGNVINDFVLGRAAGGDTFDISFDHNSTDACTQLPVGVSCVDAAGNELPAKAEYLVPIKQPPQPPGRPDVAATANPGEATLSWLASDDV